MILRALLTLSGAWAAILVLVRRVYIPLEGGLRGAFVSRGNPKRADWGCKRGAK
jgi:hypothetical protein